MSAASCRSGWGCLQGTRLGKKVVEVPKSNSTKEYGNQPGPPCPGQSMRCVLPLWEQKWLQPEGDVISLNSSLGVVFF